MTVFHVLLALGFPLVFVTDSPGDEPRGRIEGRIIHAVTMQPMPGARVGVVGHPRPVAADDAGVYRIEGLVEHNPAAR